MNEIILQMENLIINNSTAKENGGAVYLDIFVGLSCNKELSFIRNCEFNNNYAKLNGGAFYMGRLSNITFENVVFFNNSIDISRK